MRHRSIDDIIARGRQKPRYLPRGEHGLPRFVALALEPRRHCGGSKLASALVQHS